MKVSKTALRSQTKKGAASIYVVVFATILFGVITLSFIHIILSEGSQSSNDELSQSAYDAALAGVEDAKLAVAKCKEAESKSGGDPNTCNDKVYASGDPDNCYKVQKYLYGDGFENNERLIQETTDSNRNDDENNVTEQAYTCLNVSDEVSEYRTTLSEGNRTVIIRLQPSDGRVENIAKLRFKWYSSKNGTEYNNEVITSNTFPNKDKAPIPPVISYTIAKTDGNNINPDDYMNATGNFLSTIVLRPTKNDSDDYAADTDVKDISRDTIKGAADALNEHSPIEIKPRRPGSDWACEFVITGLGGPDSYFKSGSTAFLVVNIPYGGGSVDIEASMEKENGDTIPLKGAQIKVDSTGRANQLVRRVEARLNPADNNFPIPEYALQLTNEENGDETKKSFYITKNCWTEKGLCPNNDY